MRLGLYPARLAPGSKAHAVYGQEVVYERHRHRFEVNNRYRAALEAAGMILSGQSPDGRLVEIVELRDHPWFVASQFHPEFKSRPERPHPLFDGFVATALALRNGDEPRPTAVGEGPGTRTTRAEVETETIRRPRRGRPAPDRATSPLALRRRYGSATERSEPPGDTVQCSPPTRPRNDQAMDRRPFVPASGTIRLLAPCRAGRERGAAGRSAVS